MSYRSSHPKCSVRKGVLRKFARAWHRCFPMNFEKFLRTPFLKNTSWRMLLDLALSTEIQNTSQYTRKWDMLLPEHLILALRLRIQKKSSYPEHVKFPGKNTLQNTFFTKQLPVAPLIQSCWSTNCSFTKMFYLPWNSPWNYQNFPDNIFIITIY